MKFRWLSNNLVGIVLVEEVSRPMVLFEKRPLTSRSGRLSGLSSGVNVKRIRLRKNSERTQYSIESDPSNRWDDWCCCCLKKGRWYEMAMQASAKSVL